MHEQTPKAGSPGGSDEIRVPERTDAGVSFVNGGPRYPLLSGDLSIFLGLYPTRMHVL